MKWRRMLATPNARRRLNAKLGRGVWTLDRVTPTGRGTFQVGGWVAAPVVAPLCLTVDGQAAQVIEPPVRRPDLDEVFPYLRGRVRGFELTVPAPATGNGIELDIVTAADQRPFGPHRSMFVPAGLPDRWPVPDAARMQRVLGSQNEASFRLTGYSVVRRLDAVLRQYLNRPLASLSSILDWGCGCGRLLRHLPADGVQLTGADIDADNVEWCRANLPFARYVPLPLLPPAPIDDGQFDAIIGISVFTHLTEDAQWRWLSELARLARPGGIVLTTVHGPTAQAMSGDHVVCDGVDLEGFVDGSSADLDAVLADKAYYRTSYHGHDYIRENWGRFLDVIDIIPNSIGGVHDLVVLRKREG